MERWVKCVMRKYAYVGDRLSIVNSCEWACCTLVVSWFNCIKSEYVFVIFVSQVIYNKSRINRLAFYVGLGLVYLPVTDRQRRSILYRLTERRSI